MLDDAVTQFHELTTTALIQHVRQSADVTPRELVMLDRLCMGMEEIDELVAELQQLRTDEHA